MEEKKYEEVGTNYRYFLSWRHAAFAGELVILYGIFTLTISAFEKYPKYSFIIPLFTFPIGILFWMIDRRIRDLYHAAITAGKELEHGNGGFYTELDKVRVKPGNKNSPRITQTTALNILFWGSSILLLFIACLLFFSQN